MALNALLITNIIPLSQTNSFATPKHCVKLAMECIDNVLICGEMNLIGGDNPYRVKCEQDGLLDVLKQVINDEYEDENVWKQTVGIIETYWPELRWLWHMNAMLIDHSDNRWSSRDLLVRLYLFDLCWFDDYFPQKRVNIIVNIKIGDKPIRGGAEQKVKFELKVLNLLTKPGKQDKQ